MSKRPNILSINFIIGFFSSMSFFFAIYYLIPVLPIFLKNQGFNNSKIGLVISVYYLAAIFFRTFMGRLSDFLGFRNLMLVGALISAIASPLYLLTGSLPLLMLIRIFHGAGTAAFATSSLVFVAEIAPRARLAQSIGIYVTSITLSMGLAPAVAILLMKKLSFNHLLIIPAFISLVSALLVSRITWPVTKRERPRSQPFFQLLKDRNVVLPALTYSSCSFTFGTITAFVPLYVLEIRQGNAGMFFAICSLAMICVRFIGGGLADRFGRFRVILPAMLAISAGVLGLSMAKSATLLLASAIFYGLGYGLAYPSLNASVIDRVKATDRGSAMGIFTASADLGVFLGPLLIGLISQRIGFSPAFMLTSFVPLVGAIFFLFMTQGQRVWEQKEKHLEN